MADILDIDDQDRTISLCRRAMPEHTWHGPARSWAEATEALKGLRRRVSLVLLDVHFDIEDDEQHRYEVVPNAVAITGIRERFDSAFVRLELDLVVLFRLEQTRRNKRDKREADRHCDEDYDRHKLLRHQSRTSRRSEPVRRTKTSRISAGMPMTYRTAISRKVACFYSM